ncbi:hypothetical protein FACS189452_01530 [Bacteroidia bacterium]|nr:hypothetical protein FACS189452_01530 [Bacteroidia bacterium]
MNQPIKVVMLVSYDYEYVFSSLPLLYAHADTICLSIDKNRQTWSGNKYELPNSFFDRIKAMDVDEKITIYEDDFYDPNITTMQNDTRQRNMTRNFVGKDGWCVQVDSDEYFYDFGAFVRFLHTLDSNTPQMVVTKWISMYKADEHGIYAINALENQGLAAINFEQYSYARGVADVKMVKTYFTVWHQSWARPADEIKCKLENWSHKNDFDTQAYFEQWMNLTPQNYKTYKNFHPVKATAKHWISISYIPTTDIPTLLKATPKIKRKIMAKQFFKYCFMLRRPGFFY